MFAKLRSAIGGLYAYRHLTTEAEAVYKQSQELCATSPEANFRLAQLYMEARRFDEAITVLEQLESRLISANADDRQRQIVAQTIEQLREAKRQADKKQSEANAPSESK